MDFLDCLWLFLESKVAVIVSISALGLSIYVAWLQRRHMKLTVKPIPAITFGDYENEIKVYLENNGLGPLHIIQFRVGVIGDKKKNKKSLVDCMDKLPFIPEWETFVHDQDHRYLRQGESSDLLCYKGDDNLEEFQLKRDEIRKILSKLEVEIIYSSVYDTEKLTYKRNLEWFGREK